MNRVTFHRRVGVALPIAGLLGAAGLSHSHLAPVGGRSCHSATFTPEAGIVVFGGASFCGTAVVPDSNLWSLTGSEWRRLPGAFVMPREDAILVYDSRRRAIVLFGGRARGTVFADTWEWRDSIWQRRAGPEQGPGPIEHGAGAYDPNRGRFVVFGGANQGDIDKGRRVWEWDGTRWSQSAVASPPGRVGLSMTYSRRDGGVLMYGGFNRDGSLTDFWRWDGVRWTQLDSAGPTLTEGYALVDTDSGAVVLGTGEQSSAPGTRPVRAWRWRNRRWNEYGSAGPPWRVGQSVTYDANRGRIVLFGGAIPNAAPVDETWELRDGRWLRVGK